MIISTSNNNAAEEDTERELTARRFMAEVDDITPDGRQAYISPITINQEFREKNSPLLHFLNAKGTNTLRIPVSIINNITTDVRIGMRLCFRVQINTKDNGYEVVNVDENSLMLAA